MEPQITILNDEDILEFRINNIDVSIINAIRRVLLSNIKTVVIKKIKPFKNDDKKIMFILKF